ncbi:hypothetical protein FO519_004706 [Halicephalobus sp. NKZ332]|nr:hypothetical protein FO519_004706 [Halicephalobus sp. NKZ332]
MESMIKMKMFDEELHLAVFQNLIAKSSVKSAFLLADDAIIRLFYVFDGKKIVCGMNKEGTEFLLPDAWSTMEFFVESDKAPSRPVTPFDTEGSPIPSKKVKMSDENKVCAKDMEWFNSIRQFALYYEDESNMKRCITPISTQIAATYAHGSHKNLTVNSTEEHPILVRSYYDKDYCVPAKVVKRDDGMDVVILQAVSMEFVNKRPDIDLPEVGMRFMMLGLSNVESAKNNLSLGCGSVTGKFDDEMRYIGSSGSANGDSGAGVWNSNGSLIGMNILVKHNPVKLSERSQRQDTHAIGGSSVFVAASVIKIFATEYIPRTPPVPIEE